MLLFPPCLAASQALPFPSAASPPVPRSRRSPQPLPGCPGALPVHADGCWQHGGGCARVSPRFLLSTWLLGRPAPARSSQAMAAGGSAGWMGSACQHSQSCTDAPNELLRCLPAPGQRAHSYSCSPIPSPALLEHRRSAGAPSFLRSNQTKAPNHTQQGENGFFHTLPALLPKKQAKTRLMWPQACSPS